MKVALVLDHYDPARGGVEHWTYQFAQRLLSRGAEVHVVASSFGDENITRNVTCHQITSTPDRLSRADAAAELLRSLDVDIIHDMGLGWYCDVFQPHGGSRKAAHRRNLALQPAWLRPCKQALSSFLPRYRDFEKLNQKQHSITSTDRGDKVTIAIAKRVRDDLVNDFGLKPEELRLIYNGVATRQFTPENREQYRQQLRQHYKLEDKCVYLLVAHNLQLKGLPALLWAMGRLREEPTSVQPHLVVAGGKRTAAYARLARKLGIEESVTFLGQVADAAPWYAAADVYVQPTHYDPCSLVVLEALASGLPVVTTSRNGASELMVEGIHGGILDDPDDDLSLSRWMRRLLDEETRTRMGMAARELALQHTLEQNTDKVWDLYEEILAKRKSVDSSRAA
ncbi:glycosyltransferase family 4 protein [Calycomorphotria hydatis]|uniref:Mannosylfructose-phosphate synthase n=1 Tax=Calycomorphotria hydatis TaxID=2528027 RepID=A0A517TEM6_9PLAN|nr:glycosyltransferase family 4 protein [Calycomorphotria hydatis]QDT66831.1 Mannosylfructose-phosphate synthase [Calycomorphotria hydatis]